MNIAFKEKHMKDIMDIPLRNYRGVQEVRVTPDIAKHWLSFNTSNRQITKSKIDQFKADMEAGNWKDDGATIRFACGKLLDGQHRLTSIVLSSVSVRVLVVFGLDSECQVTMDTGRGRTPRDVLSIEGLDSWESRTLGSGIHTIIAYESGLAIYSPSKYTNREVRDFYLEHRTGLDASIHACKSYPRNHPLLPHARTLALHYILAKVDRGLANVFFERVLGGVMLQKDSPMFHLNKRLDEDFKMKITRSAYTQMHFVIKAWNAMRKGTGLKSAKSLYPRENEPFPEIL